MITFTDKELIKEIKHTRYTDLLELLSSSY